jgi:hypothetical protein
MSTEVTAGRPGRRPWWRRSLGALLAVPMLATVSTVGAATNAEALPTSRIVHVNPVVDSDAKGIGALCPGNRVVIGGGIRLLDPAGVPISDFRLTAARMNWTGPAGSEIWEVAGQEPTPVNFPDDWKIQATAICAPPPAGLEYRTGPTVNVPGTSSVSCTGSKRVLGTGAKITGVGRAEIDDMEVNASMTTVSAVGTLVPGGIPGESQIQSFAICANPLPGLHRVVEIGALGTQQHRTTVVSCDVPGQVVHGVGYEINKGFGHVTVSGVAPTGSHATIVAAAEPGFAGAWGLDAQVICGPK